MAQRQNSLRNKRRCASSRRLWPLVVGLLLLQAGAASGAQAGGGPVQMRSLSAGQIFTFLFLTLGPIKMIGPFARITQRADPWLAHRIAWRAILFSILALAAGRPDRREFPSALRHARSGSRPGRRDRPVSRGAADRSPAVHAAGAERRGGCACDSEHGHNARGLSDHRDALRHRGAHHLHHPESGLAREDWLSASFCWGSCCWTWWPCFWPGTFCTSWGCSCRSWGRFSASSRWPWGCKSS